MILSRLFTAAAVMACSSVALAAGNYNQMAGVGAASKVATGYGLYAVTMKASAAPGAISSFYLYSQNGAWPTRWHEIDLEFTPGFTSNAASAQPKINPHFYAQGAQGCYQPNGNNLPTKAQCQIDHFYKTGKANAKDMLSFNIYNTASYSTLPPIDNNQQVFMDATPGTNIYNQYYTYYIYYTPKGIYWTRDLSPVNLTTNVPSVLPQPSFVKKSHTVVDQSSTWGNDPNKGALSYNGKVMNPLVNGKLSSTGDLMNLSFNLWDGTNTDKRDGPQHRVNVQNWGGQDNSHIVGANSGYKYIAFYPLTTPVDQVGSNPTTLHYGSAKLYSNFTTANGDFRINNKAVPFNELWHVSGGAYLYPLGSLDPRNIHCGNGALTMTITKPYPAMRKASEKLACQWLNQN